MSRIKLLLKEYQKHISIPWASGLSGAQKVIFIIYTPELERELRLYIDEFGNITRQTSHGWILTDLSNSFSNWFKEHPYKEEYFHNPEWLEGYRESHIPEFLNYLVTNIKEVLQKSSDDSVVALTGIGTLFGFVRISTLINEIENEIRGRLAVFFPGSLTNNNYSIFNARDGWNYRAVPITIPRSQETL